MSLHILIFYLEFIWLLEVTLTLSDKQWMMLSKSVAEMMCTEDLQMDQLPGTFQYERPRLYMTVTDHKKFKDFLRYVLTFVGRDCFTFELVEKTDSFVRLRTGIEN